MAPSTGQEAVPLEAVLQSELAEIALRRQWVAEHLGGKLEAPRSDNIVGLCFSGGGIRSATFNLGILQGLAQFKMLHCIDYLSTVSGGGYIGTWLASWIRRTDIAKVEESLSPKDSPDPQSDQTEPIQFLRRYSNYLTPQIGLFSADTWTMIAIWLRNTILNQLILITLLASILLVPRWLLGPTEVLRQWSWSIAVAVLVLVPAAWTIGQNMLSLDPEQPRSKDWYYKQGGIQALVVVPVFIAAWISSAWLSAFTFPGRDQDLLFACSGLAGLMFSFLLTTSIRGNYARCSRHYRVGTANIGPKAVVWASSAVAALAGGGLLWAICGQIREYSYLMNSWHVMSWGTPIIIGVFSLVIVVYLGLLGRDLQDDRREWWSRLGAWLFIYGTGWIGLFGVAIYGPKLVDWLIARWAVGMGVSFGWVASTISGILAGKSPSTGKNATTGAEDSNKSMSLLAKVGPVIFIAGLLLGLSYFIRSLVNDFAWYWTLAACVACLLFAFGLSLRVDINEFSLHNFYKNRLVRAYMGASRGPKRKPVPDGSADVDVDDREPNPFTGLDPRDDLHLARFSAAAGYTGPYPILNAALNLVHGEELAWQERKAESFVFTPKYCGYSVHSPGRATHEDAAAENADSDMYAYRPTLDYAYPDASGRAKQKSGIHIGTAMAISGAAASPNMGAASSATSAFLLTVFDVRLGWWLGNPRSRTKWQDGDPNIGLIYLIAELTGQTNDKRKYVYLSDGGHFENFGVYELVRRRCRYVIVCDSEEDHNFKFGGLGNAIRKCRADFGVEIRLDVDRISRDPTTRKSETHCVVGSIEYPEVSGHLAMEGVLVYIKSSLTGDEPSDVLQYAADHPEFPHQTTADQWFEESQFESYRRLGLHIADATFGRLADAQKATLCRDKVAFFNKLKEQWYPPNSAIEKSFTRHTAALDHLMERLRDDNDLKFLDAQIYPEWKQLMDHGGAEYAANLWLPKDEDHLRRGFYFCNSLIQMMENVYLDLDLDSDKNFEHPDNRGWLNLFNHWVWSGMFRVTWAITGSTYGARFQTFCENKLQAPPAKMTTEVAGEGPADTRLNFHEKELLGEIWQPGDQVYVLQIEVEDIAGSGGKIAFTFGFAIVNPDGTLAYIRVQNHLRNMGLGRRAIALLIQNDVRWGDRLRLRHPHERFGPHEPQRIERLFNDLEPKHRPAP